MILVLCVWAALYVSGAEIVHGELKQSQLMRSEIRSQTESSMNQDLVMMAPDLSAPTQFPLAPTTTPTYDYCDTGSCSSEGTVCCQRFECASRCPEGSKSFGIGECADQSGLTCKAPNSLCCKTTACVVSCDGHYHPWMRW
mmetsp:Transcript_80199/g.146285  ORF Transcript_80199/g.146285 Transcript_80199/m.146285 type:complete len:141 (+) Transcript_80199:95-517(+)